MSLSTAMTELLRKYLSYLLCHACGIQILDVLCCRVCYGRCEVAAADYNSTWPWLMRFGARLVNNL